LPNPLHLDPPLLPSVAILGYSRLQNTEEVPSVEATEAVASVKIYAA